MKNYTFIEARPLPWLFSNLLLKMKLITIIIFLAIVHTSAKSYSQINLNVKNRSLEKVFESIGNQTGYTFFFSGTDLKEKKISISVKNMGINEVLEKCLKDLPYSFKIIDNNVVIKPAPPSFLDRLGRFILGPYKFSGIVTDSLGHPLSGASVKLSGINQISVTNEQGEFLFNNLDPGEYTFSIAFVGYKTFNEKIVITNASVSRKFVLRERPATLEEVMVSTGYQTSPKERLTGSFGLISGKQIEKRAAPNLLERIEGLAAGLLVNVGQPDRSLVTGHDNFTIRGTSTINANRTPLIVLNGFPTELDLVNINPNDIENITLLKDAAAASIWGVRAANGVIVIQTKNGKFNTAVGINYSSNLTFSAKPRLDYLPVLGSADFLNFEKELVDKAIAPLASSPLVLFPRPNSQGIQLALDLKAGRITQAEYDQRVSTLGQVDIHDQYNKYILQNAFSQQHNISLSGGSSTLKNYLSASYTNEYPNAKRDYGQRFTVDFSNETQLTKNLIFSANLNVSLLKNKNNGIGLSGLQSDKTNNLLPYSQIADGNGNGNNFYYRASQRSLDSLQAKGFLPWNYNYLDELQNADNSRKSLAYRLTSGLTYKIIPTLSIDLRYMMEKSFDKTRNYYNPETYFARNLINSYTVLTTHALGVPLGGVLAQVENNQDNYNLRSQINFSPNLNAYGRLDVLFGAEIRQTVNTLFSNTSYGYDERLQTSIGPNYNMTYRTVDAANSKVPYQQSFGNLTNRYASVFGNFSYTYLGKYSLSGSIRKDDSNLFGSEARIKNNPLFSFGTMWRLGEESFFKKDWINLLNIRATYGFNGNINNNSSPLLIITPSSTTDAVNNSPFATIFNAANPELSAERVKTVNFGIEFDFFKHRFGGTIDGYWRKSLDLLGRVPINPTYGFTSLFANQLQMTGRGIDLELHGTIINSADFSWLMGGNVSYNKNRVTKAFFQQETTTYYTNINNPVQGQSLGSLYVYRFAGLNATGNPMMYTGTGTKILSDDRAFNQNDLGAITYSGVTSPRYFGGINNTIVYKRFELYSLLTFKAGHVFLRPGPNIYFGLPRVLSSDWSQRWRNPGDEANTNVPSIDKLHSSLINYSNSDLFVENASYIRLRDISLTYHLPVEKMKWRSVKTLDVSATGRNLAIWTANGYGIDPDYIPTSTTVTLPPSKTFILSIKAGF